MTTDVKTIVLVLQDGAGNYFLLPLEVLERGRVPEEQNAEVERLLAEADADVSGYVVATTYTLFRAINLGAKALGDFTADAALVRWSEQQMLSGGPA